MTVSPQGDYTFSKEDDDALKAARVIGAFQDLDRALRRLYRLGCPLIGSPEFAPWIKENSSKVKRGEK